MRDVGCGESRSIRHHTLTVQPQKVIPANPPLFVCIRCGKPSTRAFLTQFERTIVLLRAIQCSKPS